MWTQLGRAATMLLSVGLLAGCGQVGLFSGSPEGVATGLQGWGMPGGDRMPAPGHRSEHGPSGLDWLRGIELTDVQRDEIQAIADSYRPEPLDVEALRSALADLNLHPKAPPIWPVEAFVKVREVLTEAQRAELIARLEAMATDESERPDAPMSGDHTERLANRLNLDDVQSDLFQAFVAKLPSPPPPPDAAAHREAWRNFLQTGDGTHLESLMPPAAEPQAFPVDEFLALAQALRVEQRQVLLSPPRADARHAAHGHLGHPGDPHGKARFAPASFR